MQCPLYEDSCTLFSLPKSGLHKPHCRFHAFVGCFLFSFALMVNMSQRVDSSYTAFALGKLGSGLGNITYSDKVRDYIYRLKYLHLSHVGKLFRKLAPYETCAGPLSSVKRVPQPRQWLRSGSRERLVLCFPERTHLCYVIPASALSLLQMPCICVIGCHNSH